MSPVILPVVRNEPSHDFGRFGSGGGSTWAIGSPFRVTRMGFPVLLTLASTAKQVALNLEIVISSGSMKIYYHGHRP